MNKPFDYIAEANVTASNNFHGDKVPLPYFRDTLREAISIIERLDGIKKTLFYGRELTGNLARIHAAQVESPATCQTLPYRIHPEGERGELLFHSIVGMATECGELLEMLNEVLFEGKPFDEVNFIEEVGDNQWYQAIGLGCVNATFEGTQAMNIAKLRHRFPAKFTEYDANNRDLFSERRILERSESASNTYGEAAQALASVIEITGDGTGEALPLIDVTAKALNRAAARGLRVEISGPTGCGKTLAAENISRMIPNAVVVELPSYDYEAAVSPAVAADTNEA